MSTLKIAVFLISLIFTMSLSAKMGDDPLLSKVMSEIEYLPGEADGALEWDIDAWLGRDLEKLWLKTSGDYSDSDFQDANLELVYSKALYTNWDIQFGLRHDFKSEQQSTSRNWASFGYIGTAPYFVEVDARLFIGEESSSQLLIELEREFMLTQEWVLTPEIDIIANGRSNEEFDEGSGFAEIELSIRLGYEHEGNRKFQPFVGISGTQTYGTTKRITKAQGNKSGDIEVLFGIHSWF